MLVVPIGAFSPYFILIISRLTHLDPFYYIFEHVLPNPMYRDISAIYFSIFAPLPIYFLGTMEMCRLFVMLLGALFILMDRLQGSIYIIMGCIKKFRRFSYYYNCFLIRFKRIEDWCTMTIYLALSGIFWATVATCWVSVKRGPSMGTHILVYIPFVLCFVGLIIAHTFLIPLICEITEMFFDIRQVQGLRS